MRKIINICVLENFHCIDNIIVGEITCRFLKNGIYFRNPIISSHCVFWTSVVTESPLENNDSDYNNTRLDNSLPRNNMIIFIVSMSPPLIPALTTFLFDTPKTCVPFRRTVSSSASSFFRKLHAPLFL